MHNLFSLIFYVDNHVEMVWLHQLGDINKEFPSSSVQWMLLLEMLVMTQLVNIVYLFGDYLARCCLLCLTKNVFTDLCDLMVLERVLFEEKCPLVKIVVSYDIELQAVEDGSMILPLQGIGKIVRKLY